MPQREFIGHQGLRIAADVAGDPSHPAVLFSHGAGQTRHAWGGAAQALAGYGFYTISIDLRGHGDSEWSAEAAYEPEHFAADIRAIAATLPAPPALVGASLGGISSLIAVGELGAAAGDAGASALVMVDIAPRLKAEGVSRIVAFMAAHRDGFASLEQAADAVAAFLPHRPRPQSIEGLRKNLRSGPDGRLHWHWDPDFAQHGRLERIADWARLSAAAARVALPTLLVRGERSEIVDAEHANEFLAMIPGAEYVEIGRAHHMVAGDDNNAFADAVVDFLRRTLTLSRA